jgi:hypothetical protein
MVLLDQELISRAYTQITDRESAHRVWELTYAYELAVEFHHLQFEAHLKYDESYELELRAYVAEAERRRVFRRKATD